MRWPEPIHTFIKRMIHSVDKFSHAPASLNAVKLLVVHIFS